MNIPLLRKVRASLIRQSKDKKIARFDMEHWGGSNDGDDAPICHTAACLAGEAVIQAGLGTIRKDGGIKLSDEAAEKYGSIQSAAMAALKLTDAQADRLFFLPEMQSKPKKARWGWPKKLAYAYTAAMKATERAKIGAERVATFIRSKGRI